MTVICPALCLSPPAPSCAAPLSPAPSDSAAAPSVIRLPSPQGSRQLIDTVLAGRMHLPFQDTQFAEQQRMIR